MGGITIDCARTAEVKASVNERPFCAWNGTKQLDVRAPNVIDSKNSRLDALLLEHAHHDYPRILEASWELLPESIPPRSAQVLGQRLGVCEWGGRDSWQTLHNVVSSRYHLKARWALPGPAAQALKLGFVLTCSPALEIFGCPPLRGSSSGLR